MLICHSGWIHKTTIPREVGIPDLSFQMRKLVGINDMGSAETDTDVGVSMVGNQWVIGKRESKDAGVLRIN